ncbi:flagellar protein FliT [Brevibacillus centrosporus]|uniref:flagellar protein FliT n=1 Tax=Brevibacillus centrosporus TaxID=54910 RepID=UPI002E1EA8D0|nr:flagellar protein FliT [Brevibacillus centrosporus]
MIHEIDPLLETLIAKTDQLAQLVEEKMNDTEECMAMLDEREKVIDDVTLLLRRGLTLSKDHKQQLARMQEINLRILEKIELRKSDIKKKLDSIQQKKVAKQSYNQSIPNGYGAFFDRKK